MTKGNVIIYNSCILRIILSVLAIFPYTNILGQNVLTMKANMYRDSDDVEMRQMTYMWAGDEGEKIVWDFGSANEMEGCHIRFNANASHQIERIENDNIYTHYLDSLTLLQTKKENRLCKITYHQPKKVLKYPFQYGDTLTSSFSAVGTYCGDHHIQSKGNVYIEADGYGTLILPNKDTIRNVLRTYTLTTTSIAMDMDTLTIDTASLRQVIEEQYDWYARGYRYPICKNIISTSYTNLNPIASTKTTYFFKREDYTLSNDTENDSIQRADSMDRIRQEYSEHDIIDYDVEQKGEYIIVNYSLSENATVTCMISDAMGVIYDRKCRKDILGNNFSIGFDCSRLHSGQYILYINVNGKIYNEHIVL